MLSSGHRGFQPSIAAELCHLTIGALGIVFDAQQLIAEQGSTDGIGVEGAIPHKPALAVGNEAGLVGDGGLVKVVEVDAFHLPSALEPLRIDQVITAGGAAERCRQRPVGPKLQPVLQRRGPCGGSTEQDGETDQKRKPITAHV